MNPFSAWGSAGNVNPYPEHARNRYWEVWR